MTPDIPTREPMDEKKVGQLTALLLAAYRQGGNAPTRFDFRGEAERFLAALSPPRPAELTPMTVGFYSCARHGKHLEACCADTIWNPPRPVPATPAEPTSEAVAWGIFCRDGFVDAAADEESARREASWYDDHFRDEEHTIRPLFTHPLPSEAPSGPLRTQWLRDIETLHVLASRMEGETVSVAGFPATVYDVAKSLRGIADTLTARVTHETDPRSDHFIEVLTDVLAELRIPRDSTKGSLAQQVAHELRIAHSADPATPPQDTPSAAMIANHFDAEYPTHNEATQ